MKLELSKSESNLILDHLRGVALDVVTGYRDDNPEEGSFDEEVGYIENMINQLTEHPSFLDLDSRAKEILKDWLEYYLEESADGYGVEEVKKVLELL